MSIQRTQTLRTNHCSCHDYRKYVIAGNPDLYKQNTETNELVVVADHNQRKFTIFDSILVFCECGNLTIHSPTINNGILHSREMWKRWRGRCIKLVWNETLPTKERTLLNVSKIELHARDAIDRTICFVNDQDDNFNIHPEQLDLAKEIFLSLIFDLFKFLFFRNINYRIRDIASSSAKIAYDLLVNQGVLSKYLPDIIQEMYNIRHISKSQRLYQIRLALEQICIKIGVELPNLGLKGFGDTGQPHIIKELVAE